MITMQIVGRGEKERSQDQAVSLEFADEENLTSPPISPMLISSSFQIRKICSVLLRGCTSHLQTLCMKCRKFHIREMKSEQRRGMKRGRGFFSPLPSSPLLMLAEVSKTPLDWRMQGGRIFLAPATPQKVTATAAAGIRAGSLGRGLAKARGCGSGRYQELRGGGGTARSPPQPIPAAITSMQIGAQWS